jgi:hypothetical protein
MEAAATAGARTRIRAKLGLAIATRPAIKSPANRIWRMKQLQMLCGVKCHKSYELHRPFPQVYRLYGRSHRRHHRPCPSSLAAAILMPDKRPGRSTTVTCATRSPCARAIRPTPIRGAGTAGLPWIPSSPRTSERHRGQLRTRRAKGPPASAVVAGGLTKHRTKANSQKCSVA